MQLQVRCECGTAVVIERQVTHGEPLRLCCPGCEEQLVVGAEEWAGLTAVPPLPPAGFRGLISAHPAGPSPA